MEGNLMNNIKVVVVSPGFSAHVAEIPNSLSEFERIVEGRHENCPADIPGLKAKGFEYEFVCNESGRANGSHLNRTAYFKNGVPTDIISGKFIVVKYKNREPVNLDEEECELVLKELNSVHRDPWASIRTEVAKIRNTNPR